MVRAFEVVLSTWRIAEPEYEVLAEDVVHEALAAVEWCSGYSKPIALLAGAL